MTQGLWRVYLLKCSDGSSYCGATNDLERRVGMHNSGKASRYTRGRLPVKLLACSGQMNKGEALSLEAKIKKLPKEKKVFMIEESPGTAPKGQ